MKITIEEYNKIMEKLMSSKKFKKMPVHEQLIYLFDKAGEYDIKELTRTK